MRDWRSLGSYRVYFLACCIRQATEQSTNGKKLQSGCKVSLDEESATGKLTISDAIRASTVVLSLQSRQDHNCTKKEGTRF